MYLPEPPSAAPPPAHSPSSRPKRRKRKKKTQPKSPRPSLCAVSFNCNGLTAERLAEVTNGVERHAPDVIMLQELKSAQLNGVVIPGYDCFVHGRTTTRTTGTLHSGGGLATLVRSGLCAKVVQRSRGATERLDVRVSGRAGSHVLLVNIYRPGGIGNNSVDKRTDDFDPELLPRGSSTFIAGDLNLHHPSWDSHAAPCGGGERLRRWMDSARMSCWNSASECTRLSAQKRSSPDLVIASSEHARSWKVLESWGSDHLPVLFHVPFPGLRTLEQKPKFRWAFHLADWDGFRADTEAFSRKVLGWRDPHESAQRLASAIHKAAERHIGHCSNSRKAKGWWTQDTADALSRRNDEIARQRTLTSLSQADADCLKDLRSKAKDAIGTAKRAQLEKLLASASSNTKPIYDFLRRSDGLACTTSACKLADDDGSPVSDPRTKANMLGEYYSAICGDGRTAPAHPPNQSRAADRDPATLLPSERDLTLQELQDALLCTSPGSSAGPDKIPTTLLLNLGPSARAALLHVFNLSWRTSVVPRCWRQALITPLPKPQKDPSVCSAYRPISLTSNICKLLERILKTRLSYLFAAPSSPVTALRGCQAGFQRLRSTAEQVALFAQSVSNAHRQRRYSVALFFDMEKAFDTVKKQHLHEKLCSLGVPKRFRLWIEHYLDRRTAAVVVDGVQGSYFRMKNGVPQGTVLSPLLFCCLLDDLASGLEKMPDVLPSLFADDLAVVAFGDTYDQALRRAQEAVAEIESHCPRTGLRISKAKSVMMPAGPRSAAAAAAAATTAAATADPHTVVLPSLVFDDNTPVPSTNVSQLFLGVHLDPELSFARHVEHVISRFRRRVFLIRALRDRSWGACRHLLRAVFLTYVLPVVTYCLGIWGPFLTDGRRTKIDKEIAWAARLITGCPRNASNAKVAWEAHLEDMDHMVARESAIAYERFKRLPGTSGFRATAGSNLANLCFLSEARKTLSRADVYPKRVGLERAPLMRYPAVAPWDRDAVSRRLSLSPFIDGLSKRLPTDAQRELALGVIDSRCDTWTCYTDGSVESYRGGAGAVIYRDTSTPPLSTTKANLGVCTSSYRAEVAAITSALDFLCSNVSAEDSCVIYTDSQSAVRKLVSGPAAAREEFEHEVWARLRALTVRHRCAVHVQFVPGHAGIPGNDLADSVAELGRTTGVPARRLSFSCAKCLIRRFANRKLLCEPDSGYRPTADSVDVLRPHLHHPRITRAGETIMSRLRVEWHPLLRFMTPRGVRHAVCDCGKFRTLHHMLKHCSRTIELRKTLPRKPAWVLLIRYEVEVLQFLVEAGLLTCSIDSLVSPQLPAAATIAVALAAAAAAAEISERHT